MDGILKKGDKNFPKMIDEFAPDIKKLYYRGNLDLLETPCVSVVGSRKCSVYGKTVSKNIGKRLGQCGITVVSGLARGIDTESHIGAFEGNGKTIAVLAGGACQYYPPENRNLQDKIGSEGLLLSLHPNDYKSKPYDFPIRNRIISAICHSLVVVEATSRSGALITSECACEQGKNVYAVPGNITSIYSFGTNTLIKEGAKPLVLIDDLIDDIRFDFNLSNKIYINEENELGEDENFVYSVIREAGPLTIDELYRKTNIIPSNLNGIITILEMKGIIFLSMGKIYVAKV